MAVLMRIDTAPVRHLVIVLSVFGVVVTAFLIAALAGPSPNVTKVETAYRCKDPKSHTWDPTKCSGVQLGNGSVSWHTEFGPLYSRNRFWSLAMTPYRKTSGSGGNDDMVTLAMTIDIAVSHRNDPHAEWKPTVHESHRIEFRCHSTRYQGRCKPIGAVFEQTVTEYFHTVTITPTVHGGNLLGDVEFTLVYGDSKWTTTELVFNIIYLISSLGGFLGAIHALRKFHVLEWHFEQGCTVVLSLGIILYNNPFFALEFLVSGWFTLFLDSFLKTAFVALLFMYWLLLVDKNYRPESWQLFSKWHLPHVGAVAAFFLFSVVAFTWSYIRDSKNPVFGQDDMIAGVVIFRSLAGMVACIIVVWLMVLTAMSLQHMFSSPTHLTRFIYFGVSTAIVGISLLLGAFVQGYGVNSDAMVDTLYFGALYNSYVWLMIYATWPSQRNQRAANPRIEAADDGDDGDDGERTSITGTSSSDRQKLLP